MRLYPARLVHGGGGNLEPPLFAAVALPAGALVIGAPHEGSSAHIGDALHRLFGSQPVRHFHNRTLGIAVQQQIALRVHHNAAANLVAPVVIVRDTAQAALDAAQNDRRVFVGFAAALAVNNGRAVRALAAHVAGGVGIVTADFAVRGVAVDHGVHVAAGHAPEQVGLAQHLEGLGARPVRLCDDAHPETLRLEHAPNHCHAEAGMVHVGVAGDDDDVAAVPAQLVHFGAAHRQEWRCTKPRSPVLAVAGYRLGGAREKRDVDRGVHRNPGGDALECKVSRAQAPADGYDRRARRMKFL